MKRRSNTILFTGGGSGGHVFPGFGVIDELAPMLPSSYSFAWVGSRRGIERSLVEQRGIPYFAVSAGKLRRYISVKTIPDGFRFLFGLVESYFLLLRIRPALLFSKGGFVSVGPVLAAGLLGIPVVSHESDLDPGLATRINLKATAIQCVAFQASREYYPSSVRLEVTGNPVRRDISQGDGSQGRELLGFSSDETRGLPLLFVQGGSLGARQINEIIRAHVNRLLSQMCIVHQTGDPNWDLSEIIAPELAQRYVHRQFFRSEYPHILAAADLLCSRSGAGSLWEMGIAAKAAVLVPLVAGARGDQLRNARFAQEQGAALVIEPGEDDRAADALLELAADEKRRAAMAASWSSFIHRDGARNIARLAAGLIAPVEEQGSQT